MKRLVFVLILLLTFVFSVQAFSVVKDKIIAVNGYGEISIDPNVAYIRFGVEAIRDNAAQAQQANANKMNKLIKVLKDMGIEDEKIETYNFSLNPLTKRSSSGKPKIVGYRCDNQIKVTIDSLDMVGKVIDKGISAGADTINSLRFSVKDESKYKFMALEKAVEDARGKARSIEKAARLQIKKIHSIIEKGADVRPIDIGRGTFAAVQAVPETPIMSGKIKITANVKVNFEY